MMHPLSPIIRLLIKLGILIVSIGFLAGYAFSLYWFDDGSKLGIVLAIAILCMDLFTALLFLSGTL